MVRKPGKHQRSKQRCQDLGWCWWWWWWWWVVVVEHNRIVVVVEYLESVIFLHRSHPLEILFFSVLFCTDDIMHSLALRTLHVFILSFFPDRPTHLHEREGDRKRNILLG